jgi:hypothetical protein
MNQPSSEEAALEPSHPARPTLPSKRLVGAAIGCLVVLVVVVVSLAYLGLQRFLLPEPEDLGVPLEIVKNTPGPFASPLEPSECSAVISSGGVQVSVPQPVAFSAGGQAFSVVPISPGRQSRSSLAPETIGWVCGTVINYVLELEPSDSNTTLLDNLRPGDEIVLRLSTGLELVFRFTEKTRTQAEDPAVTEQARPRATVYLEDADGSWLVAIGEYVSEHEPIAPPDASVAQVDQQVTAGAAVVTVLDGHTFADPPAAPPDAMYYLVEFSVQNAGETPLEISHFSMQLEDGVGNRYLVSPIASATGEYGSPGGRIAPGETVRTTAGYVVPRNLVGPTLTWLFSPGSSSDAQARVRIPYTPPEAPSVSSTVLVTVTDAFLGSDGDVIVVEGEVSNQGSELVTIELGDIQLSSSAGLSDLRVAAPPLPWTIQPGQSQVIELQYTKPAAPAVLLSLMGYSFEIQGLP